MRRLALVALMVVSAVVPPAAAASAPLAVDPATLTPPPNPNFDWTCTSNGQRIDCWGVERFESDGLGEGDSPFACDGQRILIALTQTLTAHRTHDAEGRVLRNHTVGTFDERWTLDGSSGAGLTSRGRWSLIGDYAIAGVTESRTLSFSGATLTVSAPGVGIVFQNTGRTVLTWDESEVLAIHGPQAFYEDFEGAIDAACEALLAQR